MGVFAWLFYIIMGIIFFFIISFIDSKYNITKMQKLIISIILMMIVSGICFRFAINYTDNIFLIFVFLMITDIIYNSYFIERDFFDKNSKNIHYYILLVIIGFIVNEEFINRVTEVFLTGNDLRLVLWFLSFIFIYQFFKEKEILNKNHIIQDNFMSIDSVLASYAKLKYKFYDDCCYENKEISNMIYAIMIYENSKRSKILRDYDYFIFRLNGNSRKLGIMQVESKKFITDSESIEIVHKKIEELYQKETLITSKKKRAVDIGVIFDSYCGEDAKYVKHIFEIIKKF